MNQSVSFGKRLREERLRLDLSQTEFGAVGGVTKKTQMLYEADERSPDGSYLAAIATAKADVLYILTGKRNSVGEQNQAEQGGSGYGYGLLSKDEQALLDNYRNSPPEGQTAIKTTCAAFAQSANSLKKGKAA